MAAYNTTNNRNTFQTPYLSLKGDTNTVNVAIKVVANVEHSSALLFYYCVQLGVQVTMACMFVNLLGIELCICWECNFKTLYVSCLQYLSLFL